MARYYLADLGRNKRISTEITGYFISALCALFQRTGEAVYLDAARRAARFLTDKAWDADKGLFPFEWPPNDDPLENRAYFFDSGIIVRGLLRLHRITLDPVLFQVALECAKGMRRFDHGGVYVPILQLPGCEPLPPGDSWSSAPGCFQLKAALAWLELHELTSLQQFHDGWETALKRAIAQEPLFLPQSEPPARIMDRLHAYCYFLEGILAAAPQDETLGLLRDGIAQVSRLVRAIASEFVRSDVYAQLLRIRLMAHAAGLVALDERQAEEEAAEIRSFQWLDSEDRKLRGAYSFGRRTGAPMPFANPVSTAFCIQALELWEAWRNNRLRADWRDLI